MKNIELVQTTLQFLKDLNVSDVIVCAGARNAPLVYGLEHENFNLISYFEERSAAFYGLGLSRASAKPVAIITTSGTAAVELFPAVVEAYYQNIPLIIITADRPRSYRGTGAPQVIDQVGLFKNYVESSVDWDVNESDFLVSHSATLPIHLNLCFDEPLIDGEYLSVKPNKKVLIQSPNSSVSTVKSTLEKVMPESPKNPLVIVSELLDQDRPAVFNFLKKSGALFYAEFLSGFLNHPDLHDQQITHLEGFKDILQANSENQFQTVIRIGGVPTHRIWRDLENKYKNIPVISFSSRNFSGLSRNSQTLGLSQLSDLRIQYTNHFQKSYFLQRDLFLKKAKEELLNQYPLSEPSMVQQLSDVVAQDPLYVGNSLPIREWDLFSSAVQTRQPVFAHRGANGIDGQISGYLGWSSHQDISWCLVGDLTALYDLSALGLSSQNQKRIAVMNNSGGQIFNRLFKNKKYLNSQSVDFSAWAKLWNWSYSQVNDVKEITALRQLSEKHVIIELKPDAKQTTAFWSDWDEICQRQ